MHANGDDNLLRMLKNNGLGDELLNDSKSLLNRLIEKQFSSGSSTGSRNGSSMERSNVDARVLLRKSRSISCTDDETITPILPSPLMPSVRRLHSSPKTFGPHSSLGSSNGSKTKEGDGGNRKDTQLESSNSDKEQSQAKALSSIGGKDAAPSRNGSPADGASSPQKPSSVSSLKSGLSYGDLPTRLPSGREVFLGPSSGGGDKATLLKLTRLKASDDSSATKQLGEVDLAQEARNAWKPRVRVEDDGLENLPWPTKAHRTGAGVLGQSRNNGLMHTGNLAKSGESGANNSTPGRVDNNSNRAERRDDLPKK